MAWETVGAVVKARFKRERVEVYRSELLYLLVKRHYRGVTEPAKLVNTTMMDARKHEPDKNIIKGLIDKLKG